MTETPDLHRELNCLDPKKVTIRRNLFNALVVEVKGGETYEKVTPVRSFPLTAPTKLIGFINDDGDELALLEDLKALDRASREVLEEELERRYFIPHIHKVVSLKNRMGVLSWDVETDRGARRFEVRERDDIRHLPGTRRVLIRDVDGNRYEIEDTAALDVQSQTFLETVV